MDDAEERPAVCENQLKEKERKELIAAKAHELFSEELWGMDHALFWAATRDRQAMAEYFASPERAVFGETFRDMQFAVLIQRLNRLGIERRASLEDLVKAARQGAIAIEGKKNGASDWTVIPSRNWAGGLSLGGLQIFEDCTRGPYASEPETPHRTVWTKLQVSRQQVMDAFPEHEPDPKTQIHVSSPWADDEYVRANREYQERPWWERSRGATIDDILGDAENGHLSGAEVEALARERGWRDPMSSWREDSPSVFKQDHWNFAMAVAWICWRSEEAVREVWPYWLERHYHWRKTTVNRFGPDGAHVRVSGVVLEPFDRSHATVMRLRSLASSKDPPYLSFPAISIDKGIGDLLSRLRADEVHATWHEAGVSPEVWVTLTHDGHHNGPQFAGTGRVQSLDCEILIPQSEILTWWLETSSGARRPRGRPSVKRANAEREIEKMIAEEIDVFAMGGKALARALEERGVKATPRTAGRAKGGVTQRIEREHK